MIRGDRERSRARATDPYDKNLIYSQKYGMYLSKRMISIMESVPLADAENYPDGGKERNFYFELNILNFLRIVCVFFVFFFPICRIKNDYLI